MAKNQNLGKSEKQKPKKEVRVSFDFDDTLDRLPVQKYAADLISTGVEVWIVTSRFNDNKKYQEEFKTTTHVDVVNKDIWAVAAELGIPKERVHFTDFGPKWHFFALNDGFIWHLDDNWSENREILNNTKTKAIDVLTSSWIAKCKRVLKSC